MECLLSRWVDWKKRRRLRRLPFISTLESRDFHPSDAFPIGLRKLRAFNASDALVGRAVYAVSPLGDRVYILHLEIAAEHMRRGYATAILWYLSQSHGRPLTAVNDNASASGFWQFVHELQGTDMVVTAPITTHEMKAQTHRWESALG